jgi:23S rRNA pseudouridine2605 synthase
MNSPQPREAKEKMRLNKYLAACGIASRRKADELIREGRISVNQKVIRELGKEIDPDKDKVYYDAELIHPPKRVYYLLHKPEGYVTTTDDEKKRAVVTELVPPLPPVFPVGRLDINTTGLLILTNDGDFANDLMHPRNGWKRTYIAKLNRPLQPEHQTRLIRGVVLDKIYSKFTNITPVNKAKTIVRIETAEGRNHFVKKMCAVFGYTVEALHRESFGPFALGNMAKGSYRKISIAEIDKLRNVNEK